jgi:hypothetical protein
MNISPSDAIYGVRGVGVKGVWVMEVIADLRGYGLRRL